MSDVCPFDFAGRDTGPSELCVLAAGHEQQGVPHRREDGAESTLGVIDPDAPMGLNHYEFRPLPDGSGVQVSQSRKAIWLDWAAALNLGSALIDAYRRRAEDAGPSNSTASGRTSQEPQR